MSIQYCEKCGNYIDTDFNAEHFDEEFDGCEYNHIEEDEIMEDNTTLEDKLEAINKLNK